MRPLDSEQIARIVDLYKDGNSLAEIHRTTGIGLSTVTKYVREAGLDSDRLRRRNLTKEEIQKIIQLHQEGCSLGEIAKITGRRPNTVRLHLAQAGLDGEQQRVAADQITRIIELHDEGLTNAEIAEATGHSRWTVSVQLRATGRDARRSDASKPRSGREETAS